jgi:hypothetical protein
MKRWIGAAAFSAALLLAVPVVMNPATAASPRTGAYTADASKAADLGARRRHYRHHADRPHSRPYYYARPTYYRPYPYDVPVPFVFGIGFGFGPWW